MAAGRQVKYQVTVPIDRPVVDGDIVLLYYYFSEYDSYEGPAGGFYTNGWWHPMDTSNESFGWISSITNDNTAITIMFTSDAGIDHVYATVIHTDTSNIK